MALRLSIREPMAPGATLIEQWKNLRTLGFEGVELTRSSNLSELDNIKAAMRESGIQPNITSAGPGCLIDARKEERDIAVKSHKDAIDLAAEIGAVGVLTAPGIKVKMQIEGPRPRIPDLRPYKSSEELEFLMMAELFGDISAHAQSRGVYVILEPLNRYEQVFPKSLADGVRLCEAVGNPHCKIMADLFHMNIEDADMPASIREAGDAIVNVHLADSHRQTPGRGHTDFVACFAALKDIGYDYYCGLECGVPGDAMEELARTATFLREAYEG
ncbi:sugar phosphate isomerase/epimerase [Candidatus Poribacteria bacterium]|jgi:sugar phosphate isomerase/epimerase|nr:sugar phosphate isomerase/epimerase [Candidatus Poribacteria bacterium]MBT5709857.1 sugar phosphate isomerase/epimerase [Candidatus Poribacteria bacterium]MBT7098496.1 sugar phosphate isomerase/epimerase [Candidatus Poribacteria bacterium]MBT7806873.1 sugar phosphate isomerase/epimerase [Candidatus Poribacteria bacterium]